jgi:cation diffusion facilitator CzcD-associated flavoprotein CzcO
MMEYQGYRMTADSKFRLVVAGAGVSGLFMAETLKRARIDFAVSSAPPPQPAPG